ncbi:MAG: hypothetical protein GY757_36700, partial [bacterium]|nr:hypothetical protein [bacterium]
KEKEIYRRKGWFQTKGPVNIVDDRTPSVDAIGDKIVVVSDHVHFFDKNGKKLFTSTYKFEKIKFKSEHKKLIFDYYNTSTGLRRYYEAVKPRLVFPEYFPAIRTCWVVDEKIYILTFKTKDGNSEIVVLDANGKFVKKVMVPFRELDFVGIYPSTIKDGKFYQLVETADGENWELHISQMK